MLCLCFSHVSLSPSCSPHFLHTVLFSLSELQLTCPDLSSSQTLLLGKGKCTGREKIYTCARLHKLGVKERAQVKISNRKNRTNKKQNREVEFQFDLVFFFCEVEDRYAGKDRIRASPAGGLSQH